MQIIKLDVADRQGFYVLNKLVGARLRGKTIYLQMMGINKDITLECPDEDAAQDAFYMIKDAVQSME